MRDKNKYLVNIGIKLWFAFVVAITNCMFMKYPDYIDQKAKKFYEKYGEVTELEALSYRLM